jgi:hypothetical protein
MDATSSVDLSSIRVIGAAVTPAVMVSACGILATGLDQAMGMAYGALISFVMTSLLYLTQRRFAVPEVLPVLAFSVGVLLLGGIAVFALASLRLGRDAIALEKHELYLDANLPAPTGERKR